MSGKKITIGFFIADDKKYSSKKQLRLSHKHLYSEKSGMEPIELAPSDDALSPAQELASLADLPIVKIMADCGFALAKCC